jgi:hypothetical protein
MANGVCVMLAVSGGAVGGMGLLALVGTFRKLRVAGTFTGCVGKRMAESVKVEGDPKVVSLAIGLDWQPASQKSIINMKVFFAQMR